MRGFKKPPAARTPPTLVSEAVRSLRVRDVHFLRIVSQCAREGAEDPLGVTVLIGKVGLGVVDREGGLLLVGNCRFAGGGIH